VKCIKTKYKGWRKKNGSMLSKLQLVKKKTGKKEKNNQKT
jgi:hypothetical protein